jgi:hypothetical protein
MLVYDVGLTLFAETYSLCELEVFPSSREYLWYLKMQSYSPAVKHLGIVTQLHKAKLQSIITVAVSL